MCLSTTEILIQTFARFSRFSSDRSKSGPNHFAGGRNQFVNTCSDISAVDRNNNILAKSARQILLDAMERCGNHDIRNFGIFLRLIRKYSGIIASNA